MRTSWGSATDRGLVRDVNEDALLAFPPVFLVADGMGGHDAGEVASRVAVEEFAALAGRAGLTADDVHGCFGRTAERLRIELGRSGGTTVVGAALTEDDGGAYWLVFNVGDSRAYRFADGRLYQVSVDHSVVQELIDEGDLAPDAAQTHPERHILTRALGAGAAPEPDYWLLPVGPQDRLLLCTDGLTRELDDADIAQVLAQVADPQRAADALVERAVERGARDNVTAVVVDAQPVVARHAAPRPAVPQQSPALEQDGWDEVLHGSTVPRGGGPAPFEGSP